MFSVLFCPLLTCVCSIRINNVDIPPRLRTKIEDGVAARAARLAGTQMLRPLMTFLDNRLEEWLANRPSGAVIQVELTPASEARTTTSSNAENVSSTITTANVSAQSVVPTPTSATISAPVASEHITEASPRTDSERQTASDTDDDELAEATEAMDELALKDSSTEKRATGTRVSLKDLKHDGLGIVMCVHANIVVSCGRCHERLEMQLAHRGGSVTIECTRCHSQMAGSFTAEQMHMNSSVCGHFQFEGCDLVDFLPSDFRGSCIECSCLINFRSLPRATPIRKLCTKCFSKLLLSFEGVSIVRLTPSAPARGGLTDQVKRKEREVALKPGQPLPSTGTCKHYKRSYRWLRFPCCGKLYPCDVCHDLKESHEAQWANRMVCGYCSVEQPYANKPCKACEGNVTGSSAGKIHWEGGKGCRDKSRMTTKDPRKYTGLHKTVSKRAAAKQ